MKIEGNMETFTTKRGNYSNCIEIDFRNFRRSVVRNMWLQYIENWFGGIQ